MKLFIFVILNVFILANVLAKSIVSVRPIGTSPKGQFVAIEEYGHLNNSKIPFSKIKIMNVWKQKYVGKPVSVTGSIQEKDLTKVRAKAARKASKYLKKYSISG